MRAAIKNKNGIARSEVIDDPKYRQHTDEINDSARVHRMPYGGAAAAGEGWRHGLTENSVAGSLDCGAARFARDDIA